MLGSRSLLILALLPLALGDIKTMLSKAKGLERGRALAEIRRDLEEDKEANATVEAAMRRIHEHSQSFEQTHKYQPLNLEDDDDDHGGKRPNCDAAGQAKRKEMGKEECKPCPGKGVIAKNKKMLWDKIDKPGVGCQAYGSKRDKNAALHTGDNPEEPCDQTHSVFSTHQAGPPWHTGVQCKWNKKKKICEEKWTGDMNTGRDLHKCIAKMPDPCEGYDCGEHGDCQSPDGDKPQCACRDGYTGNKCEIPPDVCEYPQHIECGQGQNHGKCEQGKCICTTPQTGYTGEHCEIPPNKCEWPQHIECGEHGQCVDGKCVCKDAYSGTHCEIPPDPCEYPEHVECGQAEKRGTCVDGACKCNTVETGYSGTHCEIPPDKCKWPKDVDCGTWGQCEKGKCKCLEDTHSYIKWLNDCEKESAQMEQVLCKNALHPSCAKEIVPKMKQILQDPTMHQLFTECYGRDQCGALNTSTNHMECTEPTEQKISGVRSRAEALQTFQKNLCEKSKNPPCIKTMIPLLETAFNQNRSVHEKFLFCYGYPLPPEFCENKTCSKPPPPPERTAQQQQSAKQQAMAQQGQQGSKQQQRAKQQQQKAKQQGQQSPAPSPAPSGLLGMINSAVDAVGNAVTSTADAVGSAVNSAVEGVEGAGESGGAADGNDPPPPPPPPPPASAQQAVKQLSDFQQRYAGNAVNWQPKDGSIPTGGLGPATERFMKVLQNSQKIQEHFKAKGLGGDLPGLRGK